MNLDSGYMTMATIPSPRDGILALERAVRGEVIGAKAKTLTVREVCAVLHFLGRTPELQSERNLDAGF